MECCPGSADASLTRQARELNDCECTLMADIANRLRACLQIGTFMTDIADEFKIVVVEAIRSLCLKFPQKYRALMNFLSTVLREDGGFEYKKAIVDSILILIRQIPDAKESGLAHLCEFIEVCHALGRSAAWRGWTDHMVPWWWWWVIPWVPVGTIP